MDTKVLILVSGTGPPGLQTCPGSGATQFKGLPIRRNSLETYMCRNFCVMD